MPCCGRRPRPERKHRRRVAATLMRLFRAFIVRTSNFDAIPLSAGTLVNYSFTRPYSVHIDRAFLQALKDPDDGAPRPREPQVDLRRLLEEIPFPLLNVGQSLHLVHKASRSSGLWDRSLLRTKPLEITPPLKQRSTHRQKISEHH